MCDTWMDFISENRDSFFRNYEIWHNYFSQLKTFIEHHDRLPNETDTTNEHQKVCIDGFNCVKLLKIQMVI